MTEQLTPDTNLPSWHWHVLVHDPVTVAESDGIHDSGWWPSATADDLARELARQMITPNWPDWEILIFPDSCTYTQPVLRYPRSDFEAWLADQPADVVTELMSRSLPSRNTGRGVAAMVEPSTAWRNDFVPTSTPESGPDAPPAGLPGGAYLPHVLHTVEAMLDEQGLPDRSLMLTQVGELLVKAIDAALTRSMNRDVNALWTDDHESVLIVAKVAATFVATVIGTELDLS